MLMALDQFVFSVETAAYDTLTRSRAWRWADSAPIGGAPIYQFVGEGKDSLTLSGVLLPEITGGQSNIGRLAQMAQTGEPFLLMGGAGDIFGWFLIAGIEQTQTFFLPDGTAQKTAFTLKLEKYAAQPPQKAPDLPE